MDMDDRLRDIIEAQPGADRRRLRTKFERLREQWAAIAMLLVWLFSQMWTGTDWLHARESNERVTGRDIERVRAEVEAAQRTFVRQDVFIEVLKRIDDKLASIESKVDNRGR